MGFGVRCNQFQFSASKFQPSPFHYNISKDLSESVGKTFGVSREKFQNVYVPGQRIACLRNASKIPGPTKYSGIGNEEIVHKSSAKIMMKGKLSSSIASNLQSPPPNSYAPSYRLTTDSKFSKITFGIGKRTKGSENLLNSIYPGPSTYIIPCKYDDSKRLSKLGKGIYYLVMEMNPIKLNNELQN